VARTTLRRALAIREVVYGPEHPKVAITLGNLGRVQWQLGESDVARAALRRVLAINERFLGPTTCTASRRALFAGLQT
jgi:Tfp pilus assembly protein PilF